MLPWAEVGRAFFLWMCVVEPDSRPRYKNNLFNGAHRQFLLWCIEGASGNVQTVRRSFSGSDRLCLPCPALSYPTLLAFDRWTPGRSFGQKKSLQRSSGSTERTKRMKPSRSYFRYLFVRDNHHHNKYDAISGEQLDVLIALRIRDMFQVCTTGGVPDEVLRLMCFVLSYFSSVILS